MRILQVGLVSLSLALVCSVPAPSQDSAPPPQVSTGDAPGQTGGMLSAPPPASFNDVIDRVVQREHLFVAQMRHMRPMVETYLQDLKSDGSGKSEPVKDQYFLGRLDMSDG